MAFKRDNSDVPEDKMGCDSDAPGDNAINDSCGWLCQTLIRPLRHTRECQTGIDTLVC